jgi:hypothetical protein
VVEAGGGGFSATLAQACIVEDSAQRESGFGRAGLSGHRHALISADGRVGKRGRSEVLGRKPCQAVQTCAPSGLGLYRSSVRAGL